MKLEEFGDIENKTDEEIKENFELLLWEAIENVSDIPENLPEGIQGECCNNAALHWQKQIQESLDAIVDNAIYDYRQK
jgi:hypothetical protein